MYIYIKSPIPNCKPETRHWLTWTALVGLALVLRLVCAMLLQNPSYLLRAVANEQVFHTHTAVQGYLAHKKPPPPLGPP